MVEGRKSSTPWWRAGNAEVDIGQLLLWLQMAVILPFLVLVRHGTSSFVVWKQRRRPEEEGPKRKQRRRTVRSEEEDEEGRR
mgnify:FL=1